MWVLESLSGTKFFVSGDKGIQTVGKNPDCDLRINDDKSISRVHAQLKVSPEKLIVIDLKSSYGIFLNEQIKQIVRCLANEEVELRHGDLIRFGRFQSQWRVKKNKICVVTSTVSPEDASNIQRNIQTLSGSMFGTWHKDCTHLVMSEIVITFKVLLALVSMKPIVHPRYFAAMVENVKSGKEPPDVADFIPAVKEENLLRSSASKCTFQPDQKRSRLFNGKRFVFFSQESMNSYQMVIELAGGVCLSIDTDDSLSQKSYVQLGTIVIKATKPVAARDREKARKIEESLKENGCRFIPEKEIALAIVFNSTRKFCNPRYDFSADFMANTARNTSCESILVQETPTFEEQVVLIPEKNIILPETVEEDPIPATATEDFSMKQMSRDDHVEIPETLEDVLPEILPEPTQVQPEKRKRSAWRQVEKDEEENLSPPRKSSRVEQIMKEKSSNIPQASSSGEKRKLRNALDDDEDNFVPPPPAKKSKQKTLTITQENKKKSQEKNQSQVTMKSTQDEFISLSPSLPRSTNPSGVIPESIFSAEAKSTGWITRMLANTTLDGSQVKEEKLEDQDENNAWINSVKVSIKIQPLSWSLEESRAVSSVNPSADSVDGSTANSTSGKNFKAFKKKQNFIPHRLNGKLGQISFNGGEWKICNTFSTTS